MAKRKKRKMPKSNIDLYADMAQQRSVFPQSLITAFVNISVSNWENEHLYNKYIEESKKYLGEKYNDRIEAGKLVVLLSKSTGDLKCLVEKQNEKRKSLSKENLKRKKNETG